MMFARIAKINHAKKDIPAMLRMVMASVKATRNLRAVIRGVGRMGKRLIAIPARRKNAEVRKKSAM